MITNVKTILLRDLATLEKEISSFDAKNLWTIKEGITNSAGNLCLHLIGNLNHFIGAGMGKTGFVRDRESEFALKNIPASEIVQKLQDTSAMIQNVLSEMDSAILDQINPFQMGPHTVTNGFLLIQSVAHLNYHLGQINYLRRLTDKMN